MAKPSVRQITLHFSGDSVRIIDFFKKRAKTNFRTTEQDILFELNSLVDIANDLDSIPPVAEPSDDDIKDMENFVNEMASDETDSFGFKTKTTTNKEDK